MLTRSAKKTVPIVGAVVLFAVLTSCRGLGLHAFMAPSDTYRIVLLQMILGLTTMAVFMRYLDHYSTFPIQDDRDPGQCLVYLSLGSLRRAISQYLVDHVPVISIFMFGGASVALNFGYVMIQAHCMYFYREYSDNSGNGNLTVQDPPEPDLIFPRPVVQLLANVTKTGFLILEIALLKHLSAVTHRRDRSIIANACIVILMGTNLAIWLVTFLEASELLEILPPWDPEHVYEHDLGLACMRHSTAWEVYVHLALEGPLFPFASKFCLTSLDVLYRAYFIPVLKHQAHKVPVHKEMFCQLQELSKNSTLCLEPVDCQEEQPILDPDRPEETYEFVQEVRASGTVLSCPLQAMNPDQRLSVEIGSLLKLGMVLPGDEVQQPTKTFFMKIQSSIMYVFSPITAMLLGILEGILIKFFLVQKESIEARNMTSSMEYINFSSQFPLVLFSILADGIPLVAVTAHCFCVIRQFPHRRKHPPVFSNSILLALLGITVLSSFKMIVSGMKLGKTTEFNDENVLQLLTLIETMLFLPQFFLQSLLIYVGQRTLADPSNVQYSSLQGALSYIAMNNFMHWGISSFLESEYLTNRMELQKDVQLWDTLVLLFTPTFIYFYFLSAFLLLQVKTMLDDSGKPSQRWTLRLKVTGCME